MKGWNEDEVTDFVALTEHKVLTCFVEVKFYYIEFYCNMI